MQVYQLILALHSLPAGMDADEALLKVKGQKKRGRKPKSEQADGEAQVKAAPKAKVKPKAKKKANGEAAGKQA